MSLIDSFAVSNSDMIVGIFAGSYDNIAQSITGDGQSIDTCNFFLIKSGSGSLPTGNGYAVLYAHSGTFGTSSVGTGTELARSAAVDVSTISASALESIEFIFSGDTVLANGTKYVLAFEYDGGDEDNYVGSGCNQNGTGTPKVPGDGHAGNFCYLVNPYGWGAFAGMDLCFQAYGKASGASTPSASPSSSPSTSPSSSPSSSPSPSSTPSSSPSTSPSESHSPSTSPSSSASHSPSTSPSSSPSSSPSASPSSSSSPSSSPSASKGGTIIVTGRGYVSTASPSASPSSTPSSSPSSSPSTSASSSPSASPSSSASHSPSSSPSASPSSSSSPSESPSSSPSASASTSPSSSPSPSADDGNVIDGNRSRKTYFRKRPEVHKVGD